MKIVAAVSGGVDSVVLLDMLVKKGNHELTVAHFDHGMREDSAADARFVEALAKKYSLPFVAKREELGQNASEAMARQHRYAFLREEAKRAEAVIATAHHLDDLAETIAINLQRGTGWRGVAVLDSKNIERPLLSKTKGELYDYAIKERLEWVEDSTNHERKYLRNKLRILTATLSNAALIQLWNLRDKQVRLRHDIHDEVEEILPALPSYERHLFIMIDALVALELIRIVIERATGKAPTRPQAERALLAIKAARAGASAEVGGGVVLRFTSTRFVVSWGPKVLS